MGWSEQQKIEFAAPEYLKNLIQIVTETGLRIYKELAPLRKEHLDLMNGTVWIPDSKTVNGVAGGVRSIEKDVTIHANIEPVSNRDLDCRLNVEVAPCDFGTRSAACWPAALPATCAGLGYVSNDRF